jgi:hypothetical protein
MNETNQERKEEMDDSPKVTVICDRPVEGFTALVYLKDGLVVKSEAKSSDAWDGFIKAVSNLIVDIASDLEPMPDVEDKPTKKDLAQVHKHVGALRYLHSKFADALAEQISIAATAQQFTKDGMPEGMAQMLVGGIIRAVKAKRDRDESDNENPNYKDDVAAE